MATLPRNGVDATPPQGDTRRRATQPSMVDMVAHHTESVTRAKSRSPTRNCCGNDTGKGNGNSSEEEEGLKKTHETEREAILLAMSDMSDTESEGGVPSDQVALSTGFYKSSYDEEMKETDEDEGEKPMELELCDDSDAESHVEVELVLVGDELVELERSGGVQGQPTDQETCSQHLGVPTAHGNAVSQQRGHAYTEIDVVQDEKLMRAVVACEDELVDPTMRKMVVWDAIVLHCGVNRFRKGEAAQSRVTWLRRVRADPAHRAHGDLSEELRRLLAQYEAMRKRIAQSIPAQRTPEPPTPEAQRLIMQRIGEKLQQLHGQHNISGTQDGENVEESEDDGLSPLPRLSKRSKRQPAVDAALEVKVMRIVLRHAAKLPLADIKMEAWDKIAEDSRGRYASGECARTRTAWLCKLVKNVSHSQHANITPALRKMLECLQLSPTRVDVVEDTDELFMKLVVLMRPFTSTENSRRKTTVWSEIAQTAQNPRIRCGRNGRARVQFLVSVFKNPSHIEHAKLSPGLRSSTAEFLEMSGGDDHGSMAASGESSDEHEDSLGVSEAEDEDMADVMEQANASEISALLREILRSRPFHADHGTRLEAWDDVARVVGVEFSTSKQRPTGLSCRQHMKQLLRVARNPRKLAYKRLSEDQVELLELIRRLIKTSWPQREANRNAEHRQLQREIDDLLGKTRCCNQAVAVSQESDSAMSVASNEEDIDNAAANKRDSGRSVATEEPSHRPNKRKRSLPDESSHGARNNGGSHRKSMASELNQTRTDEIKALHTEVAMCRAQMTIQSTSFENERREHRADLRATMEMLKLEREVSNRETSVLLGLLKQEQEERKHQFVAMMNLVTRSMPQLAAT